MAKKDLSAIDRDIAQPLGREISDAFTDGINCDVKIMGGKKLTLYDPNDENPQSIYTGLGGTLIISTTPTGIYGDETPLTFGDDSDMQIVWDGGSLNVLPETDGNDIELGSTAGTLSVDIKWFGSASDNTIIFSSTGDKVSFSDIDLYLADDDHLYLGSSGDVNIYYDASNLQIIPATDADGMIFGDGDHGWTITAYGGSTSQSVVFTGAATNTLVFNDIDVQLGVNDILGFGDAASPGNVYMRWDGEDFDILAAADDTIIKIGATDKSFDIWWYAGASTVKFDEAAATVTFDAANLVLGDDDYIYLGDNTDVSIRWDNSQSEFEILPAADDAVKFMLGAENHAWDIWWYGAATTNFVKFLSATNIVQFDDVDLLLGDGDHLYLGDSKDVDMNWTTGGVFAILPILDHDDIIIGSTVGNLSWDITWYGSSTGSTVVFGSTSNDITLNGVDLSLEDDDHLYLGDNNDVDMSFNGANDFFIVPGTNVDNLYLGATGGLKSWDIYWTGASGANTVLFGAATSVVTFAAVDLKLGDNCDLQFGTGSSGDFRLFFDETDLRLEPITALDHADFVIGSTGDDKSIDVKWIGDAQTNYVLFDSTNNLVEFEATHLLLNDDAELRIGSTGTAGDVVIDWDSTGLIVACATDNTDIIIGNGTNSFDIDIYGSTASKHIKWVADSDELDVTATIEMQTTNKIQFNTTGSYIHASTGSQLDVVTTGTLALSGAVTMDNTLSASGIATFNNYVGLFETTGTSAVEGQIWYNSATDKLNFFDGASVRVVTSS